MSSAPCDYDDERVGFPAGSFSRFLNNILDPKHPRHQATWLSSHHTINLALFIRRIMATCLKQMENNLESRTLCRFFNLPRELRGLIYQSCGRIAQVKIKGILPKSCCCAVKIPFPDLLRASVQMKTEYEQQTRSSQTLAVCEDVLDISPAVYEKLAVIKGSFRDFGLQVGQLCWGQEEGMSAATFMEKRLQS